MEVMHPVDHVRIHSVPLECVLDMYPLEHENAVLLLYFASGFAGEALVARIDLTRLQRASECAEQSACGRGDHVIEGCRIGGEFISRHPVVIGDLRVDSEGDLSLEAGQAGYTLRTFPAPYRNIRLVGNFSHDVSLCSAWGLKAAGTREPITLPLQLGLFSRRDNMPPFLPSPSISSGIPTTWWTGITGWGSPECGELIKSKRTSAWSRSWLKALQGARRSHAMKPAEGQSASAWWVHFKFGVVMILEADGDECPLHIFHCAGGTVLPSYASGAHPLGEWQPPSLDKSPKGKSNLDNGLE